MIIHNVHGSNFGNLMIKYLVAGQIAVGRTGVILSGYEMPYWSIESPRLTERGNRPFHFRHDQRLHLQRARQLLSSGIFTSLEMHGHLQRMENLPDVDVGREAFVAADDIGCRFGAGFIVCPIRGAETLGAIHSGYTLLPVEFYADVFERTGLRPVFCGQTDQNVYVDSLRLRFPNAIFLSSQGALADFQTIRAARHIVIPVSTFAWMAAWLSKAESVFLPVFGLFNPDQFPDHDLLPVGDARYVFYKFPIHEAVPVEHFAVAHASIDHGWAEISSYDLVGDSDQLI